MNTSDKINDYAIVTNLSTGVTKTFYNIKNNRSNTTFIVIPLYKHKSYMIFFNYIQHIPRCRVETYSNVQEKNELIVTKYYRYGTLYRYDGPASIFHNDSIFGYRWHIYGRQVYSFEEYFAYNDEATEEEKMLLKIKYSDKSFT